MIRKSIAIVFGTKPNFNKYAFKYFLLSVNKIQNTYEFCFPDIEIYPYEKNDVCIYDAAFEPMKVIIPKLNYKPDYWISIITKSFDNNYFLRGGKNIAVITTDVWDKYFSPPSLFEYRIDIILGYICDIHKEEIASTIGEMYLKELMHVTERKWIGNIEDKGSVAYNLKHIFKFDIDKDSGFNKTTLDKMKDKFYEIPASLVSEAIKVILLALITYLLVVFGLKINE